LKQLKKQKYIDIQKINVTVTQKPGNDLLLSSSRKHFIKAVLRMTATVETYLKKIKKRKATQPSLLSQYPKVYSPYVVSSTK